MNVKLPFKTLLLLIILLTSSSANAGGWIYYTDGLYKGKILDLEGAPIEGAVVAGVWAVQLYGGLGGPVDKFCDAQESLTDKNGEFTVPRASCFHWWPFSKLGIPSFTVFKPGYLGYPPLGYTFDDRKANMPGFTGDEFRDKSKYYLIKLGRPKTRNERELTLNHAESIFPTELKYYYKMSKLLKLVNEEGKNLGFDPIGPSKGGLK